MRVKLFVAALAAVLTLSAVPMSADDLSVCESAKSVQDWLTSPNLAAGQKYNTTTNDVANLLPRIKKLCETLPPEADFQKGSSATWLAGADRVAADFQYVVIRALLLEGSSENRFHQRKLNELLAVESYRLQFRLNALRKVAYSQP